MQITRAELAAVEAKAKQHGWELAALLSVIKTESDGVFLTPVNGRPEPVIRWEGHYFDRLLSGAKREKARKQKLASPKAGAIKNPKSQAARYALLERAKLIDEDAALMSCSWGGGQVMGSHWEDLGYPSVQAFVAKARSGFAGQLEIMCQFIVKNGLGDEIERLDFAGFARGYNGPNFRALGYDKKLKANYEFFAGKPVATSPASGMLRMGAKGAAVRELQTLLGRAGLVVKVDGDFGPATRDAVKVFQELSGLTVDGVAGPATMKLLLARKASPDEVPGKIALADLPEAKTALGGVLSGLTSATAAGEISTLADKLNSTGLQFFEYAASGLYLVAGVLVVGGLAYGLYGRLKSNRTFEGTT